jgi:lysozyme family protein
MDASLGSCLAFTLAEEGGYIASPNDERFATNQGISLARLRRFLRDPCLGVPAIQDIPGGTVHAIYLSDFWNRSRCDALPAGIDLMVFDHAVNAGPDRAGRALQQAVGLTRDAVDGAIGPETLGRVTIAETLSLLDTLTTMQRTGYRRMAAFELFGERWLARLDRRRTAALSLMALAEPVSRR